MNTEYLRALAPEETAEAVARAAALLRGGELVAFPTETVYGLGADAFNADAVAGIFAAKGRPSDNPLIVHTARAEDLEICGVVGERELRLAAALMPGPLTMVIRSRPSVPMIARAGLPTVAVRIPGHPVALALLAASGPLVAPSANRSGRPSPTTAAHVLADLGGRIAAVLDGGPCSVGIESTVVDMTGEEIVILRPGVVTAERIEAVMGEPVLAWSHAVDAPKAPGMKYRHYAPSIPVRLVIAPEPPETGGDLRRLVLTTRRHLERFPADERALLDERTIYARLRAAEEEGFAEVLLYAEPGELGQGLLDRVMKAAG